MASFRSTVSPPIIQQITPRAPLYLGLLVDPLTGAPVGIQGPAAGGADGQWSPVQLSAAQIASPTAAMLADLASTYQLNEAPYTRVWSNGTVLVGLDGTQNGQVVIPFGNTEVIYSQWTVTAANPTSVQGTLIVRALS